MISKKIKRAGVFKRLNSDPEFQRRRMKGLHSRPNRPEKLLGRILEGMYPSEYRYTGSGDFVIDGLIPDFVNINGKKKVIEVFGETYHDPERSARPVVYRSTEHGRKKTFAKFGYDTLVVWTKEIYLGGGQGRLTLRRKIREFHEDCSN